MFEDLRDDYINSRYVLKNQGRFKSDLSEIKTGGKKPPNQKTQYRILLTLLIYKKKIVDLLETILFCYLNLSTKQNMEKDLKYELLNKCFKDCQ